MREIILAEIDGPAVPGVVHLYGRDRGRNSVDSLVAHEPGVRLALQHHAVKIFIQAQIELAAHHDTGATRIVLEGAPPHELDWYVKMVTPDAGGHGVGGPNMADRAAMSIEHGWTQTHAFGKRLKRPRRHRGLHILGKAMKV